MDGNQTRWDRSVDLDRSSESRSTPQEEYPSLGEMLGDPAEDCARIAAYLLELARNDELEPAVTAILDGLDEGIDQLERESRERAERMHEALFAHSLRRCMRVDARRQRGVDPYYWG
jgi:hypothetical protein